MRQPTWDIGQGHKPGMKQAKDASSKTKAALKVGEEQVRVHHLVLSHKVNDCGRLGIPSDALHAQEGCTIQLMQHTLFVGIIDTGCKRGTFSIINQGFVAPLIIPCYPYIPWCVHPVAQAPARSLAATQAPTFRAGAA